MQTMFSHALTCFLLLLCVQIIITEAQSESYIYWCYPDYGNYTHGSPFQSNLNTVLTSLTSNTRLNDFYNSSSGNGTDQAYGLIYCRGDVSEEDCRTCRMESAKTIVERCPNSKRALASNDNCWISYCADLVNSSQIVRYYDIGNATTPRKTESFIKEVGGLLKDLAKTASSVTSRLASGRSNGTYGTYGLVQCARQLSPSGCVDCLQPKFDYINELPSDGMTYYKALAPTCFVRYDKHSFFQSSSPSPAPVGSSSPLAPTATVNSQSPLAPPLAPPATVNSQSPLAPPLVPTATVNSQSPLAPTATLNSKSPPGTPGNNKNMMIAIVTAVCWLLC